MQIACRKSLIWHQRVPAVRGAWTQSSFNKRHWSSWGRQVRGLMTIYVSCNGTVVHLFSAVKVLMTVIFVIHQPLITWVHGLLEVWIDLFSLWRWVKIHVCHEVINQLSAREADPHEPLQVAGAHEDVYLLLVTFLSVFMRQRMWGNHHYLNPLWVLGMHSYFLTLLTLNGWKVSSSLAAGVGILVV